MLTLLCINRVVKNRKGISFCCCCCCWWITKKKTSFTFSTDFYSSNYNVFFYSIFNSTKIKMLMIVYHMINLKWTKIHFQHFWMIGHRITTTSTNILKNKHDKHHHYGYPMIEWNVKININILKKKTKQNKLYLFVCCISFHCH